MPARAFSFFISRSAGTVFRYWPGRFSRRSGESRVPYRTRNRKRLWSFSRFVRADSTRNTFGAGPRSTAHEMSCSEHAFCSVMCDKALRNVKSSRESLASLRKNASFLSQLCLSCSPGKSSIFLISPFQLVGGLVARFLERVSVRTSAACHRELRNASLSPPLGSSPTTERTGCSLFPLVRSVRSRNKKTARRDSTNRQFIRFAPCKSNWFHRSFSRT